MAEGKGQSIYTVQRQLRRLQAAGHITIEKRPRTGGCRWPGFAYQLNVPAVPKKTEPHDAAWSKGRPLKKSGDLALGRAATSISIEPQALRYKYSENIQQEYLIRL